MWAVVARDGTLVRGRGVVSSALESPGDPAYRIIFDRDVSTCAWLLTRQADASEFNVFERVFDIGIPEQVAVRFQRVDNSFVTSTFQLAVVC
jgi:hypothetical protein